jgi:hypothetical protein
VQDPSDEQLEAGVRAAGAEAWERLRSAVDAVEAADPAALAVWKGGEQVRTIVVDGEERAVTQMPYVEYAPPVRALLGAVGSVGAFVPYDWMSWDGHARYPDASSIAAAPLADIVRLLTAIVRADRFTEGTIATVLEDGRLVAAVERLLGWHRDADPPTATEGTIA